MKTACVVALAILTSLLAACGGGTKSEPEAAPAQSGNAADLAHIHGLGVESSTGRLFVATHNGLFQAASGASKLARVGASRQDIMGFSAPGGPRLIGSGHPAPGQDLPPNLGLIESRDGGKTWKNLSLLGKADFHVLRSLGRSVYGYNGATGRLMVSNDGGTTWSARAQASALLDLAIDPSDADHVVASSEKGLIASHNAGRRWRLVGGPTVGLLTWPSTQRMYIIDGQGQVGRSSDNGKTFRPVGSIGGQPAAFTSYGHDLYAARGDGKVLASADGGARWVVRARP